MKFFKDLLAFVRAVAQDERIPARDKKILTALIALILSPIDIIPDWIPIFGVMDDVVILALILDYLFNVLDNEILLSHYPWTMKSFARVRRGARLITILTPQMLKDKIWQYQPSPYQS
jgi:uncharacterized membrane protein YkvA (DUF1232 family)